MDENRTQNRRFSSASRTELLTELLAPCGRFNSPVSGSTRATWMATRLLSRLHIIKDTVETPVRDVPLNWQMMAAYLFREGVISRPQFNKPPEHPGTEGLAQFFLHLDRTRRKTDGSIPQFDTGFGASTSKEDALSKTVGETLERFFVSTYDSASFVSSSSDALLHAGRRALDISSLNTYLPWQKDRFPEFNASRASVFAWTEARTYPDNEPILVPSQLVYWNYRHEQEGVVEPTLARTTTSGSAGHFSREEAVLSGVLELIQRDGFFVAWLNHHSPDVLDVSHLEDGAIATMIGEQRERGVELIFLDTSSDINVPCITCVARRTTAADGPVISVGSAAGFDVHELVTHSAVEAIQVNAYAAAHATHRLPENYEPFIDTTMGREARLCTWKGSIMAQRFEFFLNGTTVDARTIVAKTHRPSDTHSQLRYIVDELTRMGDGFELIVYEAHDPTLDRLGYHVIKTIVPQLYPLYLAEYAAPLQSKRLQTDAPTPWPHPFP